jgi:cyanate permease
MYSLAMHLIGTFLAAQQKQIRGNKWHLFDVADWQMFGLIQLTIWATHIVRKKLRLSSRHTRTL